MTEVEVEPRVGSFGYPHTNNLFDRDQETHRLVPGVLSERAYGQVGTWLVTEKVDGTNIRLVLEWETDGCPGGEGQSRYWPVVSVRGRTDKATLPTNFLDEALPGFDDFSMADACAKVCGLTQAEMAESPIGMVAFGEGYGPGIQKGGGGYAAKKSLRLFDVVTLKPDRPPLWRTWADVETVASVLGLQTVPVLRWDASTDEVVDMVAGGHLRSSVAWADKGCLDSWVSLRLAEGVVARTDPYLYDYRRNRVCWKLKGEEL